MSGITEKIRKALWPDKEPVAEPPQKTEPPKPSSVYPLYFDARWVFPSLKLLGLYESDPRLVAHLKGGWERTGLKSYEGRLAGNDRAWCSVQVNEDFYDTGIKGTNSAMAASWSNWGRKCPYWFGAVLDIRHKSGGRHVCRFLYWIDKKKKIAATLDGNKGNRFCVAATDISGSGDVVVNGPRWPINEPDGFEVSMAGVLKAYPELKLTSGSTSESTR